MASGQVLAVCAIIVTAKSATAQVNAETLRHDVLHRKSRFAAIGGGLTGRAGNVRSLNAAGSFFAGYGKGRHLIFGKLQGEYGEFAGTSTVSKSFGHARYNYRIIPWLFGELFAQGQNDKFQRLQIRELYGIGPRFQLVKAKDVELFFGTSYMFEHEELAAKVGSPDRDSSVLSRMNNYVSFNVDIDSKSQFTSALYVQPAFYDFDDFRALSESTVSVEFASRLVLRLLVSVHHDNRPPSDIRPFDVEVKNTIEVTF